MKLSVDCVVYACDGAESLFKIIVKLGLTGISFEVLDCRKEGFEDETSTEKASVAATLVLVAVEFKTEVTTLY